MAANLLEIGYVFKDGKLTGVESGGGFVFDVYPDAEKNQARYEFLCESVVEYVYERLAIGCGLSRLSIPVDAAENEPTSFVFVSDDFATNDKLMVLVHGSGAVRAGMWSRRLIVNESMASGSQIPYIERARRLGYAVLVLNGNHNHSDDYKRKIRGSENSTEHFAYVWQHVVVARSPARRIAIVAHSAGGVDTVMAANRDPDSFFARVFVVAFTDSVHSFTIDAVADDVLERLKPMSINWVADSRTPVNSDLGYARGERDVPCRSAGTAIHELTSHSAIDAIFDFVAERAAS